ncbi:hypothetical protein D3C80_1664520 [compost metagenome]
MAARIDHVLPLLHHAQVAVIQVDHHHRQIVLQSRGQLLDIHLDAAVTGDAHYRFVWQCQFHPEGGW